MSIRKGTGLSFPKLKGGDSTRCSESLKNILYIKRQGGVTVLPFLWEDIFPQTGLVALAGGSDTGKSSLLRQLATAICQGDKNFLGFKLIAKKEAVTYISTEDDDVAFANSLYLQNGGKVDNVKSKKFYVITEVDQKSFFKDLEAHLISNPCDLVIIDSVSDMISGDMNSQTVVRGFLNKLSLISQKYDCLILLLHHLKKSATGQASKNQLNGSMGFEAKTRTVVILSKEDGYKSLNRDFNVVKGNYCSNEIKNTTTKLIFDEKTLTFSKIGSVNVESKANDEKAARTTMVNAIKSMKKENLSTRKIADILSERGYEIKKSRVAEIIKEQNQM